MKEHLARCVFRTDGKINCQNTPLIPLDRVCQGFLEKWKFFYPVIIDLSSRPDLSEPGQRSWRRALGVLEPCTGMAGWWHRCRKICLCWEGLLLLAWNWNQMQKMVLKMGSCTDAMDTLPSGERIYFWDFSVAPFCLVSVIDKCVRVFPCGVTEVQIYGKLIWKEYAATRV